MAASHRCAGARCAGKVREMELNLPTLATLERLGGGRAWPSLSPRRWPRAGITTSTVLRFAPMSRQRAEKGDHCCRDEGNFTITRAASSYSATSKNQRVAAFWAGPLPSLCYPTDPYLPIGGSKMTDQEVLNAFTRILRDVLLDNSIVLSIETRTGRCS
jgi:hypothetical protein